jgi:hypothetical protein
MKLDNANVPRDQIVLVTGHRNEKSLDNYVDFFSTKHLKQLSNIISGVANTSSVSDSSHVSVLRRSDENSTSLPSSSMASKFLQYPVLNLANLAQNMKNTTINITLNTNVQMPAPDFKNNESSCIAKRVTG